MNFEPDEELDEAMDYIFDQLNSRISKSFSHSLESFEIATWKKAKVHPDNYVQFGRQFFSVPHSIVDKTVWLRATEKILTVYDQQQQLIKQHLFANGEYVRTDHSPLFSKFLEMKLYFSQAEKETISLKDNVGRIENEYRWKW